MNYNIYEIDASGRASWLASRAEGESAPVALEAFAARDPHRLCHDGGLYFLAPYERVEGSGVAQIPINPNSQITMLRLQRDPSPAPLRAVTVHV